MNVFKVIFCYCILLFASLTGFAQTREIAFCGNITNDLYLLLKKKGYSIKRFSEPSAAINSMPSGTALFIVADGYPEKMNALEASLFKTAAKKNMKLYLEYPSFVPGIDIVTKPVTDRLERAVVTSKLFGEKLPAMSLLGINGCFILPVSVKDPLIVLGKVAGFDKAEYGIADVKSHPVLFQQENMMVAMTSLSNFATGRYGPADSWKTVWEYIVGWMTGASKVQFASWPVQVSPAYSMEQKLPANAKRNAIARGTNWFYNGRFLIHPEWKDLWEKEQGDGTQPVGPPVSLKLPSGDGSLGIIEGHSSDINADGSQQYRYWLRNDVQGEVSYAFAAAGKFLNNKEYFKVAGNLVDYIYHKSNLRAGARANKDSAAFGLVGWSLTHPYVFYGDDNARATLGVIGASAYMNTAKWDKEIVENILANFRTTGKFGFRGDRLEQNDIQRLGWKHFQESDIVSPHPHFESWMWACYLWLYNATGYAPLLEKTKTAIRMTMEAYPDKWKWTNGIQQERARMILPLAWLVRVEDTEEHRRWLDIVVNKLLENQDKSGAIREELGTGKGMFGTTASNKEYGLHEAPLIFENGDKVADMLYTSNFAFFSLNEAAQATGNKKYAGAVNKLSDFLTRIQVKSEKHKDVDGAWFRAFDYGRWDYWASNADAGWGAWSTLTGWIQSWIIATQVLIEQKQSYWELTKRSDVKKYMDQAVETMLNK
ncbi:hypothetical protein [Flavitalea sp.]|nr:hypothetical protein [Flavitalea sp.]